MCILWTHSLNRRLSQVLRTDTPWQHRNHLLPVHFYFRKTTTGLTGLWSCTEQTQWPTQPQLSPSCSRISANLSFWPGPRWAVLTCAAAQGPQKSPTLETPMVLFWHIGVKATNQNSAPRKKGEKRQPKFTVLNSFGQRKMCHLQNSSFADPHIWDAQWWQR